MHFQVHRKPMPPTDSPSPSPTPCAITDWLRNSTLTAYRSSAAVSNGKPTFRPSEICSSPFSDGLSVIIALCPHTASLHESRLPFSLSHPPAAFLRVAQDCRCDRYSRLLRSQTAPQSRRGKPQKMLSRAKRQPAHCPAQTPFPTHGEADARIRPLLVRACG